MAQDGASRAKIKCAMSLLHQDTPEEIDDAALGEELTKGTSHLVWATLIAAVLVTVAIAIYFIAGQKPPAVTGEIVAVWAHPQHTETSGLDANGAPMPKESFDQVLVFAEVRLHNQSKQPLFLLTCADQRHAGRRHSLQLCGFAVGLRPGLSGLSGHSGAARTRRFRSNLTLDPGQSVDGTFVSSFRLTKQQWDARKDLNFSFSFRYQPSPGAHAPDRGY